MPRWQKPVPIEQIKKKGGRGTLKVTPNSNVSIAYLNPPQSTRKIQHNKVASRQANKGISKVLIKYWPFYPCKRSYISA